MALYSTDEQTGSEHLQETWNTKHGTRPPFGCFTQTLKLLRLSDAWRLRTIPGPLAVPVLGIIPDIFLTDGGFTAWRDKSKDTWGSVYKVRVQCSWSAPGLMIA